VGLLKTESESTLEAPLKFNDVRLAIMSVFSFPKLGLSRDETQKLVNEALLNNKKIKTEDVHDQYFYYLLPSFCAKLFRSKLKLGNSDFSFNEACQETGLSGCTFETFLTVYPEEDFAILLLNVQISKCDADDLIILQQSVDRDKITIFSKTDAPLAKQNN
jgi:hypothetical protein